MLVTHAPSSGWKNRSFNRAGDEDLGSAAIRRRAKEVRPTVHAFGHVHTGYGVEQGSNFPKVINAASCTHAYKTERAPIYFDLIHVDD